MVLLFAALSLKLVRIEQVKESGAFLTSFLPVLFVAPAVNLLDCWEQLQTALIPLLLITLLSTVLVFGVSGAVTQALMKRGGRKND